MSQQNPYSRGYKAIADALEAWAPLIALVSIGNLQTQQAPGYRPKMNVNAADRPQILVTQRWYDGHPYGKDSTGIFLEALYGIEISSGQLDIDKINLLGTLCYQAFAAAGPFLGMDPTNDGVMKVVPVRPATLKQLDPQSQRPDWTAVAGVQINFGFDRKQFIALSFT
jgi:hypothetical protein